MKIAIINGSPKGEYSGSLQLANYLEKRFEEIELVAIHAGKRIKSLAKDSEARERIWDCIEDADCIIWCYPVYTFSVPYQLMKFIDLIYSDSKEGIFRGKYSSQILTSLHFYDDTAYNYIRRISEDLEMKIVHGHYTRAEDLFTRKGQERLDFFGRELLNAFERGEYLTEKYRFYPKTYSTAKIKFPKIETQSKNHPYRVVILGENPQAGSNIGKMTEILERSLPCETEIIHLEEGMFKGGCLGCLRCTFEGRCVYRDGFQELHREKILNADAVIIAASIERHWFRSIWKCFDDRRFYNGHRVNEGGKPIGYLISGQLAGEDNLRHVIEARSEVAGQPLVDIVTDESGDGGEILDRIRAMAEKTLWMLEEDYRRPVNFLGKGGMKIFRDLVYVSRGLMKEDHRFYKKNKLYDFPHRERGKTIMMYIFGFMLQGKKMRKKASSLIADAQLDKSRKFLEKIEPIRR